MKKGKGAVLMETVLIHILYLVLFYVALLLLHNNRLIIKNLSEITGSNFFVQLLLHMAVMLAFPIAVAVYTKTSLTALGITAKNGFLGAILLVVYLLQFFIRKDFSARGIYSAVYLLVSVALGEELFFRGWSYSRLKQINLIAAMLISGMFFGMMHAIYPGVVAGKSAADIAISMVTGHLGGGIVGGLLFVLLLELSGSLFIPILAHALLDYVDYANGWWGVAAYVFSVAYLIVKIKFIDKKAIRLFHVKAADSDTKA